MQGTKSRQKRMALINDISGFGRCSITEELPIISVMKIQCCPVLTSVLSNHTWFDSFYFDDYTDRMRPYIKEWEKLQLHFDGICTGFLGSGEQIDIVTEFVSRFKAKDTIVIVDPVMGDYGKIYKTYSQDTCEKMKNLLPYANIVTPNLTEACILAGISYREKWSKKDLTELAGMIADKGPEKVVITGIMQGEFIANFCFEKNSDAKIYRTIRVGTQRPGTGDIFCAIIAADAVNHVPFADSVKKAGSFVKKCIQKSIEMEIPIEEGVCFEEFLGNLK